YMAVLALLLTAFYYTKTRAAFLGLLISIIFFFSLTGWTTLFTNKVQTPVALSILLSISVSLNMSDQSSVMGRFAQDVHYTQDKDPDSLEAETGYTNMLGGTMFMRAFQYRTGIEIIKDYPVLGIGADTLGIIYPQYIARVYKKWNEHRNFQNQNRIHNDILDMTVSRGFLGLGAYVWFIFTYAVMVWKGYREADEKNKILITGLCSGCLAYFIQNQFSFGHVPIITMLWFLVGLSVITCSSRSYLSGVVNGKINTDIHPQPGNRDRVTKRGGVLRSERLIKVVLCGCIVGFMVMLVIGSSARYKADVYFSRARKLLKKNSTIEAIECYETAARLNPFELTYRTVLNEIYLRMAAITLNKRKEHIKRGLPESFTNEQATLWLNNTILGAEEVQKLYPNDYRSAFTLGQAYHTLGHISARDLSSKAMVHYQKAVTLYPFKYQIHIKLAQLYNEMGQCEKAIFVLNEAIRFVPGEPGLHLRLAKSLIKCGRYREARKTCNRILELEGAKEEKFKQNTREMLLFLDKKEARKTMPVPGAAE
ncbi:MAG: hypothetical protein GY941_02400, partial [Planctomycetes bacterium]|nr:hypothetical protein [Planctomycetota bacterium]